MKSFRHFWLLLLLAALTACGGADEHSERSNALNRAISTDPESLDIHKARSLQALDVLRDLGEGLVSHTATGALTPGVAESWEVSDDGLLYTFRLRPDAKWSNGDTVTADDFVFAVDRLQDPATGAFYAQFMSDVTRLEAVDDHTLLIHLAQPTPYLLSLLTHPATFPIHRGALAEHGDRFARPGNLVSNGAYTLSGWVPGSIITLKRNAHYWNNANTAIDEVRHLVLTKESTQLARYRAGEIDITSTVPSENFAETRKEYGEQLRIAPYQNVYYYGFNLTRPPFRGNLKLRQALSMAIDRETLVEKVLGRGETPAYSWVPTGINDYVPPVFSYAALTQDERNQIARRLYKEAGYSAEKPLDIEIRYNTSDTHRAIAVSVQSMWRDVLGFDATLVNEEFQVLLANIRAGEITQVFRSSWAGDYDDAHTFLSVFLSGSASNDPGYVSQEFDDLVARSSRQVDPDLRRAYLEEAERLLLEDQPVIPIYFYVSKHLVSPRVQGWGDNILDYHYSQHLSLKAAD
jgi:ABC-type oligopeptide transport system substrate-binding subunit